jgi:hypothetical protein
MTRWLVGLCAILALTRSARADDDPPFTIGSRPAWYLLGGVIGGGTVALADRGGMIGGELSVARLRDARWIGIYADAYHDWGTDGTYVTAGPELGKKFLGFDGGGAVRFAGGEQEYGATARIALSLTIVSIFVRYAYFDAPENDHVIQLGATLKIPLMSPIGGPR